MAYYNKLYKQLSCRDFGADCNFTVRAKTAGEVLEYGYDRSCRVHSKCGSSPKTDERMRSLIRNVWV
jgi:predicted small metal-binding protein